MSLIVLHHTVVDNFDVDPTFTVTSSNRMLQGSLVGINSSGYVSRPSTIVAPLGIAGDSLSDEYQTTAYSADLIVGRGVKIAGAADGAQYKAPMKYTSNRVSDFYNETLASGKMSVYTTGGRFATDQYDGSGFLTPGAAVYATAAGLFSTSAGGSALARTVGFVIASPTEYSSGVPGAGDTASVTSPYVGTASTTTTAGEGSMSLGMFLQVQLSI